MLPRLSKSRSRSYSCMAVVLLTLLSGGLAFGQRSGSLVDLLDDGPSRPAAQKTGNGTGGGTPTPNVTKPAKPIAAHRQLPPIPRNKTVYSLHEVMGELPPTKKGNLDVWGNPHETKSATATKKKIVTLRERLGSVQKDFANLAQDFVSEPNGRAPAEGVLTLQSLGLAKAEKEQKPLDHRAELKKHLRQFWAILNGLGEQLDLLTQPGSSIVLDAERYGKNSRGENIRYDTKRIQLPLGGCSYLSNTRRYDTRYITKRQAESSYVSKRSGALRWRARPGMIAAAAMRKFTGLPSNEIYFDSDGDLYRGAPWPVNHSHALTYWPPLNRTEFATSFGELFEEVPGYLVGADCYVNRDELPAGTIQKKRERVKVYPFVRQDTDRFLAAVRRLAASSSTTPDDARRELAPLLKGRIELAGRIGTWIRPLRVHESSPFVEKSYLAIKSTLERVLGAPLRKVIILKDGSIVRRQPHHRRMPGDFPPSAHLLITRHITTAGDAVVESDDHATETPRSLAALKAGMTLSGTMEVPRFGQYQARIGVNEANEKTITGTLHLDSIIWRPGTPAEKVGAKLMMKGTVYGNGRYLTLTVTDLTRGSQNPHVKITRGEVGVVYRAKLADDKLVGITNPKYSTFHHKNGYSFSIPEEASRAVTLAATAVSSESINQRVTPIVSEYTDTRGTKELQVAAEAGDVRAMTVLGWRYFNAVGVKRDDEQAARWFEKAAEQGDVRATHRLADCHWHGRGVKRNVKQLTELNQRAAEKGDILAISMLIARYRLGVGIESDASEAFAWCARHSRGDYWECSKCHSPMRQESESDRTEGLRLNGGRKHLRWPIEKTLSSNRRKWISSDTRTPSATTTSNAIRKRPGSGSMKPGRPAIGRSRCRSGYSIETERSETTSKRRCAGIESVPNTDIAIRWSPLQWPTNRGSVLRKIPKTPFAGF